MRDLVVSLSQNLETPQVSSDGKRIPLPIVVAGLDLSTIQGPLGVMQTLTVSHASPLQASIREAPRRGEDAQGFQTFPVIEQRDTWGNLVRMRALIPFKQLKELKSACSQNRSDAGFTQTLL